MKKDLISVILPIYNVSDYLDRCMESVINQTYRNIEIIMVDDGSTDGSALKCDEYKKKDDRIIVFHKENGGLSDARNYGIQRASGNFITCIDSDDFVDLDYIEYLYALLMKYNTKMSICQHRVLFDNGKIKENGKKGDEILSNKSCLERMLYHDVIDTSAWAKLYHRNLFDNVEYPKGKLFEDIGTTYQLMLQCDKIAVGYESKYNYIVRKGSIVNCSFSPKKLDLLEMTDKMADDVLKVYPDLDRAILRRQVYARFSTLNQMRNSKGFDSEKKQMISYIKDRKNVLLNDDNVPKRDVLAIKLLMCGYPAYKICWDLYEKIKK
mgnify:FL=1